MNSGDPTTVKCPACGKFVARITGIAAEIVLNCKTRKCGSELKVEYDNGSVTVAVVGRSNEYSPLKR